VDRTNAERQRRYIARLKERAAANAGGVSNTPSTETAAEIEALKAQLHHAKTLLAQAALEKHRQDQAVRDVARRHAAEAKAPARTGVKAEASVTNAADALAKAKATITDLRARLRYFQKRPKRHDRQPHLYRCP
jgi:hypothetical protein